MLLFQNDARGSQEGMMGWVRCAATHPAHHPFLRATQARCVMGTAGCGKRTGTVFLQTLELFGVLFGIIANDRQLEVLALEAIDHQHDPANEGQQAEQAIGTEEHDAQNRNSIKEAEDDLQNSDAAEEQDRLHSVEAYEAVLLLHEEKDDACNPAEHIAQAGGNVLREARSGGASGRCIRLLVATLLSIRRLPIPWLPIARLTIARLLLLIAALLSILLLFIAALLLTIAAILLTAIGIGWLRLGRSVAAIAAAILSRIRILALVWILSLVTHVAIPLFV